MKTTNRERLDRVMNSLLPLIFCGIVYLIMKNSFSRPLLEMYVYSSFPAGWYFLSMRKKRQMTDTEIIVREIRSLKYSDPFFDLAFFLIRKGLKLGISLVIGFLLVPYYVFEVLWGIYQIINSKIMNQNKNRGKEM